MRARRFLCALIILSACSSAGAPAPVETNSEPLPTTTTSAAGATVPVARTTAGGLEGVWIVRQDDGDVLSITARGEGYGFDFTNARCQGDTTLSRTRYLVSIAGGVATLVRTQALETTQSSDCESLAPEAVEMKMALAVGDGLRVVSVAGGSLTLAVDGEPFVMARQR